MLCQKHLFCILNDVFKITQDRIAEGLSPYAREGGAFDSSYISNLKSGRKQRAEGFYPIDSFYQNLFAPNVLRKASQSYQFESKNDEELLQMIQNYLRDNDCYEPELQALEQADYQTFVCKMLDLGAAGHKQKKEQPAQLLPYLPAKNAKFVGREKELHQLHQTLANFGTVFLSGMGGIGKSQLALQYAHNYQDEYEVILFTDYAADLRQLIRERLEISGLERQKNETDEIYFKRKWKKLQTLSNPKILWIIDNFAQDEDPWLAEVCALPCHKIFTTRLDVSDSYPQLLVEPLSRKELGCLFRQSVPQADDISMEQLFELTDCHTMAVELLAKQIKASHITPMQMVQRFQDGLQYTGTEKFIAQKTRATAFEHICHLFDLSLLRSRPHYPAEKQLLCCAALLPYDGVPISRLSKWCRLENTQSLNDLLQLGWIRMDADRLSMHPLVAEVVLAQLTPGEPEFAPLLTGLVKELAQDFGSIPREDRSLYLRVLQSALPKLKPSAANADFWLKAGNFLKNAGSYSLSRQCIEQAVLPVSAYAQAHNDLADLFYFKGDYVQAEREYQLALQLWQWPPEDHAPALAKLYNDFGRLYKQIQDYEKAIDFYWKAFELRYRLCQEKPGLSQQLYQEMGILYFDLENDPQLLKPYQKFLQKQIQLLEPDCIDPENRLIQYYENALAQRIVQLGEDHMDTAIFYHNMGVLYEILGQAQQAEQAYLTALEKKKRLFGEDHPSVLRTLENMAQFYDRLRKGDRAGHCRQQAQNIRRALEAEKI